MGLNIKNERVHELAKEAARRTGRTQTSAIEVALEEFLARTDAEQSAEARRQRASELIAELQSMCAGKDLSTDFLYDDETGLPA
ncbi:type II toxin-antitoxin system VapB family antitoxin [Branchiibius sp. NY16-3462-2]|uniref:type II toxin-antitoxin system VapB family antitoxin n=1 Tax=Branchiibius sp. NY16-3462-2 TaxID=1807500 RepID=UPI00079296F3|nr:type II toxin-antitoxin system VapB family antitoxin [Branchiibius sp. NY16-3462-2]KYH43373.1 hypothetical protein AZH51_16560 [Branchiibius sp. NY16-3462-2]